tara:strand:+ start:1260 stop:1427 length:168 start_codon:yes stop_codon:yes gene_type:complete
LILERYDSLKIIKAINGTVKINLPSSNGPITEYIVNIASIITAEINTEIFNENFV